MPTTTRLPECKCPTCGRTLSAASSVSKDDAVPSPGDISLCIHCDTLLAFNNDLSLRRVTPEEEAEAEAIPNIKLTREFTRLYRKWSPTR